MILSEYLLISFSFRLLFTYLESGCIFLEAAIFFFFLFVMLVALAFGGILVVINTIIAVNSSESAISPHFVPLPVEQGVVFDVSLTELDHSLKIIFGSFTFDRIVDAQTIDVNEATVDFQSIADLEPVAPNQEEVYSHEECEQLLPHNTVLYRKFLSVITLFKNEERRIVSFKPGLLSLFWEFQSVLMLEIVVSQYEKTN